MATEGSIITYICTKYCVDPPRYASICTTIKKGVGPLYVTKILIMCTTEWDRVYAILGPQKDKCSTE